MDMPMEAKVKAVQLLAECGNPDACKASDYVFINMTDEIFDENGKLKCGTSTVYDFVMAAHKLLYGGTEVKDNE